MQQNDEDNFPSQSTSTGPGLSQTIFLGKSRTSLVRVQNQKFRFLDDRGNYNQFRKQSTYCGSKPDIRFYSNRPQEDTKEDAKLIKRSPNDEKVYLDSDFVVSDCWKTSSGESPVKLIQLFKDSKQDTSLEEDDLDVPMKRRRLLLDEDDKLMQTKEFHVLTEVQKERILIAVEDAIKNLAYKDPKDYSQRLQEPSQENIHPSPNERMSIERFFYKKFLLPWVFVKVTQMILCHIIQLTFLSEESYFQRKGEFLPIVVTYYLTLFIIVFSLAIHITCFNYSGIRNFSYFMGVISTSILTLTTSLGILVMLCSIQYYRSFREILVLAFIGTLLCSLFAELCLCYYEVKNIWNKVSQTEEYYLA